MWGGVAVVVALAVVAARVHDLSSKLGLFRELRETDLSACSLLDHGPMGFGSEDIEFLPNGMAFISSGLRYPGMPDLNEGRPGGIFTVDVTAAGAPRPSPLVVVGDPDASALNPHGISLHVSHAGGDEVVRLFVVHHPMEGGAFESRVKIYRYEPESRSLVHEHTVMDPLLSSVNDVWAVGPDSFYATNDHALPVALWPLEVLLGLRWTNVVFRAPNGTVAVVATGFRSANGIAGSPDGRHVYVADVSAAELHVLGRSPGPGLVPLQVVALPSMPDNVAVDPATGDVWLACHPNAWKIVRLDPSSPPGMEVLRVENAASPQPRVSQVLLSLDGTLQGSSVAARHGAHLLVGSVYHRTLHCRADLLV
ncbi:serum paraoxonase/arylesterase 2-like [Lethenteron reissneri]|uniref:serum paraoxonase/arylesterase 2-like n=1 Tax=Lethenteron reissneri TaxID=7753 RepID=UPI002AB60F81|nr:serum paraoxonase/arylesterase 2-like [Lethenteron reissneri]